MLTPSSLACAGDAMSSSAATRVDAASALHRSPMEKVPTTSSLDDDEARHATAWVRARRVRPRATFGAHASVVRGVNVAACMVTTVSGGVIEGGRARGSGSEPLSVSSQQHPFSGTEKSCDQTEDFFVWLALGPRTTAPAVSSREPIRPCCHAHNATHGSFRFPLLYARRHDVRARSPRDVPFQDPAPVLAVALALTLAPVAEARVQVRPVEQTVVLDLFSPSDFNDLGVQRDFCRAFTASIDLDERVGRVVTQKFPTLPVHLLASSAPSLEAPRADTTRRFPLWRRISWTSRAIHEDHHALHNQTQILTPPRTFFPSKVLRDSQRVQAVHQMLRRRRSVRRVHP